MQAAMASFTLRALLAALLTGASLQAAWAFTPAQSPLNLGGQVEPNILFILDDSGSMAWDFMPGAKSSSEIPKTSPVEIQLQTYTRNKLYYNPSINYRPWLKHDATELTGGTSYDAAYSSTDLLADPENLASRVRTFYVPKATATDLSDARQYFRYQILTDRSIIRSELLDNVTVTPTVATDMTAKSSTLFCRNAAIVPTMTPPMSASSSA